MDFVHHLRTESAKYGREERSRRCGEYYSKRRTRALYGNIVQNTEITQLAYGLPLEVLLDITYHKVLILESLFSSNPPLGVVGQKLVEQVKPALW